MQSKDVSKVCMTAIVVTLLIVVGVVAILETPWALLGLLFLNGFGFDE